MASAAATTDTGLSLSANYTYTDDLLTKLSTPSTDYTFTYGNFGLRTRVKAGDITLARYEYTEKTNDAGELDYSEEQDFYLRKLAYGNGDSVQYDYNQQGQVTSQTYEDGDTVKYRYDNDGALATVTDSDSGITQHYIYDLIGRPGQYRENGGEWDVVLTYKYNKYNQLTKVTETIGDRTCTTSATYDDDSRIATYRKNYSKVTYSYESLGRLKTMVTNHTYTDKDILTETYTYRNPATGQTSSQVTKFQTKTIGNYDVTYAYTYDSNGNILTVSDGTNKTSYVYDSANQLTRENNQAAGKTWVYTYDNAGNITSKSTYAYTTGTLGAATDTVTYGYTHATWGDLLKEYKGSTLTYDNCGNLKSGHDWNYTWEHGRQLATMTDKDGSDSWSFQYNADGMRIGRSNGTTEYKYQYLDGQLVKMTVDDKVMYFNYDASGTPLSIVYNGTTYYYVTNLQGDIVGIVNQSGNQIVGYSYDAWGNLLSTTGSSANTLGKYNPLRYRGYVFDPETNLYYLSTRYYNPEVGRFLNADNYPTTGAEILDSNMFAYCKNRPSVFYDPSGEFAWEIVGFAAVGAAVNVATSFLIAKAMGQSYTWTDAGFAAASGAACTFGIIGRVVGGLLSGGYSAATTYQNGSNGIKPIVAGFVSFTSTFAGVGNFSGLDKVWSELGTQAFIDITFGTGSNFASSATNLLVTPKEPKKRPLITIEPAPPTKAFSRVIGPNVYIFE